MVIIIVSNCLPACLQVIDGVFVNMYYTRAGYRRSGDLHACTQFDVLLTGRARLRIVVGGSSSVAVPDT